jgi:hypothetical protein
MAAAGVEVLVGAVGTNRWKSDGDASSANTPTLTAHDGRHRLKGGESFMQTGFPAGGDGSRSLNEAEGYTA